MLAFLRGNPRFLRYWMSTWASELGDWVRNMAFMYIVLDMSKGSSLAFSLNMFCEFAPIFLFGFLVGVFADRWNRKRTTFHAIFGRALLMLYFIVAILFDSLVMVCIGSFVSAIATLFFRAAGPAFNMQFVPLADRKTAANLRQMSMSVLMVIGSPIGTLFYMKLGAAWTLGVTVVLFLISSLLVLSIRMEKEEETGAKTGRTVVGVFKDMQEGFRYSWQHSFVRPLFLSSASFGFGAGLLNVMEIYITTEFLQLPKETITVIVTAQGIAMLLASFLCAKLKLRMDHYVSGGLVVVGAGLICMVAYPSLLVLIGAIAIFSFGYIAIGLGRSTLMQIKVDFEYQGRSGMTLNTLFSGFMVVAMLTAGWLHQVFDLRPLVAGIGILIVVGGLICFWMYRRAGGDAEEAEKQVAVQS